MGNINELPQTVLIGFLVATFLLNTNRVLKAVELFKECLIILYNQAPKKENEFVIRTFGEVIYLLMLNGYSHIISYHIRLAELHQKQGKYQQAKNCYEGALDIMKDAGQRKGEAACYGNLGNVFWSLGEYAKAKEYHEKALAIAKEIGSGKDEASCYANLGTVLQSLGGYAKAKEYHEKALMITKEIGDRKNEAYCYGNLGTVFHSLAEYTDAKEYQEKALKITTEIGDKRGEAYCYIKLGNVFESITKYTKAIECHEKTQIHLLFWTLVFQEIYKTSFYAEAKDIKFWK